VRALLAECQALRFSDRAVEAERRIASARAALAATPHVNPVTRALLEVESAQVELHLRHPAEALAAAETALASLGATLGPASAARSDALQARALARMQAGDFDGARLDLDAAAAVLRAIDPDHPRLASVLIDLALVFEHRGRVDEGIALRHEVLATTVRRFGADSAEVRNQRAFLGAVLQVAERYPEAEIELREALRLEQRSAEVAGEHAVSSAMLDLASLLTKTGRAAEAVVILQQRLQRMLARGPAAAAYEVDLTRLQLARTLIEVGDPASLTEARRQVELAGDAGAADAGGGRHDVLPVFVLAQVDLAEGRLADARQRAEEALATWKRTGRESSTAAGEGRLLLGEAQLALGELAAARKSLEAAFDLLFRRVGGNDPRTQRARQLLDRLTADGHGKIPAGETRP
jgi:tetratricopeptide (TPR) repeat protein